jgi:hypothetical protein
VDGTPDRLGSIYSPWVFVRSVFIQVLLVEATIIVALWLFGHAFS